MEMDEVKVDKVEKYVLEGFMTEPEVAKALRVSYHTLRAWRQQGRGPKYLKLGRKTVRYRRQDLIEWVTQKDVQK